MKLYFGGTTTNGNHCPKLFKTDRSTIIVQGRVVTDPDALAKIRNHRQGLDADETVVEVPAELFPFVDVSELEEVPLDPGRAEFVLGEQACAELAERWR
ncbi:hypothetical protein [Sciscionella sediminilitoris]|uniref:hypothetical protein n=1 Tax=Sciscionella sediminilitoris TaxID=1445613 RepID=UPI0006916BAF|nr:hypothetical protein [Sciscionella sp. SE31]